VVEEVCRRRAVSYSRPKLKNSAHRTRRGMLIEDGVKLLCLHDTKATWILFKAILSAITYHVK
jgi:hypothetical protein